MAASQRFLGGRRPVPWAPRQVGRGSLRPDLACPRCGARGASGVHRRSSTSGGRCSKGSVGFEHPPRYPLEGTFCDRTVASGQLLVVPDLAGRRALSRQPVRRTGRLPVLRGSTADRRRSRRRHAVRDGRPHSRALRARAAAAGRRHVWAQTELVAVELADVLERERRAASQLGRGAGACAADPDLRRPAALRHRPRRLRHLRQPGSRAPPAARTLDDLVGRALPRQLPPHPPRRSDRSHGSSARRTTSSHRAFGVAS